MKALGRVVQRGGLGRGVGAVQVQLRAGQLLADQWPDGVFHPEHGVPVRCVAKVADAQEMRPVFERHRLFVGQVQHQRAPVQQVAGQLEVFHQQFDFNLGHHQVEVAAIQCRDFPLGQVGVGHPLELLAQGGAKRSLKSWQDSSRFRRSFKR